VLSIYGNNLGLGIIHSGFWHHALVSDTILHKNKWHYIYKASIDANYTVGDCFGFVLAHPHVPFRHWRISLVSSLI